MGWSAQPLSSASACSPPLVSPESLDYGPSTVPVEGVVVALLPDRAGPVYFEFVVVDAQGEEVSGETISRSVPRALVWQADASLVPGAEYRLLLAASREEMHRFQASTESTPTLSAAALGHARLTETTRTLNSACCTDVCPYECQPTEVEYRPALELQWQAPQQALPSRYYVYQWVEPLDGTTSAGLGPFEQADPTGARTSLVGFKMEAAKYCLALDALSLVDYSRVRSSAVCSRHETLEPVDHLQPDVQRCNDGTWPDGFTPASYSGGGGCSASGPDAPTGLALIANLGLLMWIRRRRARRRVLLD